jgi:hypothetical protein
VATQLVFLKFLGGYGTWLKGIDILAKAFEGWRGHCARLMSVYHTHFSFVQGGFVMMRGLGIEFKGGIERHSLVRMASCGLFKLKALTEKNYLQ